MIKAIIFDFDGVLALSEQPRFQVIQKVAANNNIKIEDSTIKEMVGRTTVNFLNDVLSETEKPLISKIVEEYEREYKYNITRYVKPIDITVNFIKNYNGPLIIALASMSSRRVIEGLTKHFSIYEKFKSILCKEDVTHHKPDPEIYLKLAGHLQLTSSECIVIEDTLVGAQSALSAYMKCYILLNGFNRKDDFTDIPVEGFIRSQDDLEAITSKYFEK